ncbi:MULTISPECIES: hypothetical protein, partial [unclassified Microcoleus]|uniref:hypothetical protein n=1 Tax=unclassified Microcoleus TaxID=2642155 RepID=UPI002FCEEF88
KNRQSDSDAPLQRAECKQTKKYSDSLFGSMSHVRRFQIVAIYLQIFGSDAPYKYFVAWFFLTGTHVRRCQIVAIYLQIFGSDAPYKYFVAWFFLTGTHVRRFQIVTIYLQIFGSDAPYKYFVAGFFLTGTRRCVAFRLSLFIYRFSVATHPTNTS